MTPTLILDTSVLISGLRFSLGASYVLLKLIGSGRFTTGSDWIVTHNIRDMAKGAARYGIDVITPGEALRRQGAEP